MDLAVSFLKVECVAVRELGLIYIVLERIGFCYQVLLLSPNQRCGRPFLFLLVFFCFILRVGQFQLYRSSIRVTMLLLDSICHAFKTSFPICRNEMHEWFTWLAGRLLALFCMVNWANTICFYHSGVYC